jgi:3-oxoacyl-[acyl-carrier protein] reductase
MSNTHNDRSGAKQTPLARRTALVTGAARGIGRATAVALAEQGATVIAADIADPTPTAQEIAGRGKQAAALIADVSDSGSVESLFHTIGEHYRRLDILVHCAGIIHEKPLLETAVEDFDRVIAVNLRGTFLVGREAIRLMSRNGEGRVVLIASDLSYQGRETFSSFVASKHGVLGLARSWAIEFAPSILVNALCPGPVDTETRGAENMSSEWRERELDIPLHRLGQPEEIAAMAAFLAGPTAQFITGQGIGVNGGSVMP